MTNRRAFLWTAFAGSAYTVGAAHVSANRFLSKNWRSDFRVLRLRSGRFVVSGGARHRSPSRRGAMGARGSPEQLPPRIVNRLRPSSRPSTRYAARLTGSAGSRIICRTGGNERSVRQWSRIASEWLSDTQSIQVPPDAGSVADAERELVAGVLRKDRKATAWFVSEYADCLYAYVRHRSHRAL